MHNTRSGYIAATFLRLLAVASLLIAGFPISSAGAANLQPLAAEGSYYYHSDGQRIPLVPSLEWVSVKFASADVSRQSAAVQGAAIPLESLEQARPIPHAGLTLLPVQPGETTQTLVQGVNAMRASSEGFADVAPVFDTPDAEMIITEEFIAAFAAEATPRRSRRSMPLTASSSSSRSWGRRTLLF
jgi:hypothetical protein